VAGKQCDGGLGRADPLVSNKVLRHTVKTLRHLFIAIFMFAPRAIKHKNNNFKHQKIRKKDSSPLEQRK
jgi:hypothetical protein